MSSRSMTEVLVGLGADLIHAPEEVEIVDVGRAEIDLQRVEHVRQRHVQHARLGAVDLEVDLRRVGAEGREHPGEVRVLVRALNQVGRGGKDLAQPDAAAILELHLEAAGVADPAHRRRRHDDDEGLLDCLQAPKQAADDGARRQARLGALLERLQRGENRGGVRGVGEGCAGEAGEGDGILHAGRLEHDLGRTAGDLVGPRERCPVRGLDDDDDVALVEARDKAGRHGPRHVGRAVEEAGIDGKHREEHQLPRDETVHRARIGVRGFVEAAIEALPEPEAETRQEEARPMPLAVRPQQQRAERRRKRQRVDRRDDRRGGDRQRELAIELAGYAGDEGGRNEHRRQHEGDGEHSAADLVHGLVRRVARRHALCDVALDILDDDDRVVDHDADREHEAEQGQRIEREAERAHQRESPYERHRDRDDRDDRRAPRLQEDDDDEDDEDEGLEERLVDLAHGLGDELGRVVDDLVVDAGGEIALELVHLLDDALRGGERIAAGALEDGERHGRLAV